MMFLYCYVNVYGVHLAMYYGVHLAMYYALLDEFIQ